MKKVTVQFEVVVPDWVSDARIKEWVSFEVGATSAISGENPLRCRHLNAVSDSVSVTAKEPQ